jgi:hypothetical protein
VNFTWTLASKRRRAKNVDTWARKVGPQAAPLFVDSMHWLQWTNVLSMALIVTEFAALASHLTILYSFFAAGSCVWLAMFVTACFLRHRYRQLASAWLGRRISWRAGEGVPRTAEHYEQWCQANGLVPYGALRTHDSAV